VVDSRVRLSAVGQIVADEWSRTPVVRPEVRLDAWVVMPNHVHGIVAIDTGGQGPSLVHEDGPLIMNLFGPQRRNLGALVRGFKGAAKTRIRQGGCGEFEWQPRYYDHVIRDEQDLQRIRAYIRHNPARWEGRKDRNVLVHDEMQLG
jgi:REP element-mobilizing transposase RayT